MNAAQPNFLFHPSLRPCALSLTLLFSICLGGGLGGRDSMSLSSVGRSVAANGSIGVHLTSYDEDKDYSWARLMF